MLPEDIESPNDNFFNHKMVEDLLNHALIHEKFSEGLFNKLKEVTKAIISKGGKGFFWVVVPTELLEKLTESSFQTAPGDQLPLGYDCVMFQGILSKKWRVYTDPQMKENIILVGAGFTKKARNFYAKLEIA